MGLRIVVLTALLGVACGGVQAQILGPVAPPAAAPEHAWQVKFVCGTFEGSWGCRHVPGGFEHGKGSGTGPIGGSIKKQDAPAQTWQDPAAQPGGPAAPPAPGTTASCPPSSELLGGNCVRYTATTCSNGLAAESMPQACRRVEEKLSCKLRADGLKDCCCVVYDKM